MSTLGDQKSGKGMAEVMKAHSAQPRSPERAVEVAVEKVVGIQWLAVWLAEDEAEINVAGPLS